MATINERRYYPRISLHEVTVEVYSSRGNLETGAFCTIVNISENGMLFKAEDKFRTGDQLRLTFVLPDTQIVVISDAKIVHKIDTDNLIHFGVQFKNLGIAEVQLLRDFVNRNMGKKVPN